MTLDLLLGQYSEAAANIERAEDLVRGFEKQRKKIKESITTQISQEFGRFIDGINSILPEDQRVTKWHVNYDGGSRKAFITVTELGGRPYYSDEFNNRLKLPRHLGDLEKFSQNYPVSIHIDMLNHAYLDIPLEEMK